MNLASVTASLDQLWRSQSLPMWLALAAAAFFAIIVLVTLLRAEKSVANGALTVITLLAIGVAAAATLRGSEVGQGAATTAASPLQATASLPAISCLDDLAGDMVLAACEKVLFGSADSVAAAVSVSAARLDRLLALGGTAAAEKVMTPELLSMRRAMERDRYGLVAYVLQSRDRCMPNSCAAYASFTDHKQLDSNMDQRAYEGLVTRYAPSWTAMPAVAAASSMATPAEPGIGAAVASNPALAGLPTTVPTGKPTTADFPSSSSIPAVSIMTDTPAPKPQAPAAAPHAAAKKQAAPKAAARAEPKAAARPQAPAAAEPTQLAPQPAQADN